MVSVIGESMRNKVGKKIPYKVHASAMAEKNRKIKDLENKKVKIVEVEKRIIKTKIINKPTIWKRICNWVKLMSSKLCGIFKV